MGSQALQPVPATVHVQCGSLIFPGLDRCIEVPHGQTVAEILDGLALSPVARAAAVVSIDGTPLSPEAWAFVRPRAGHLVSVGIAPQNIDRNILASAGSVLSILAPAFLGLSGVPGFIFTAVLQLGGLWAVSTFIGKSTEREEREAYTLTGARNQLRPGEPVPRFFGKLRVYPPLAATPVTMIDGNEHFINLLLSLGYKPVRVSDWRIGERKLRTFLPRPQLAMDTGYSEPSRVLDLYSGGDSIKEEAIDKELKPLPETVWYADTSRQIRNLEFVPHPDTVYFVTQDGATGASIDLVFPEGLYHINSGDELLGWRAIFGVRYRPYGATGGDDTWMQVPGLDNYPYETEVRSLIDSDWYAGLVSFRDRLEAYADELEAELEAQRFVTTALRRFARNTLAQIDTDIAGHLANPDISGDSLTAIGQIRAALERISIVTESAAEETEASLLSARDFSDKLSTALRIIEGVSNYLDLNAYAARGFGEGEFQDLGLLQRWIINRRNLGGLFGAPPPGHFQIVSEQLTPGAFRLTIRWAMPPGKYEVQVRRVELPRGVDERGSEIEIHDACTLSIARSSVPQSPVSDYVKAEHALAALRLHAGVDLNNSIDRVNCIVECPLPWHDGEEWQPVAFVDGDGRDVYRNPAWAFAHIAREYDGGGEVLSDDYIDLESIREAALHFHTQGYHFDGALDRSRTKQQAMEDVLAVARATPIMTTDGKWSIAYERPQGITRGFVTPRNARNFSITRNYVPAPHVIRVKYVNAAANYVEDEIAVYADGYGDPTKTMRTPVYFDGGVSYFAVPFTSFVDYVEDTITGTRLDASEVNIAFPSGGDPESRIFRIDGQAWSAGDRRWRVALRYTPIAATIEETVSTFGMVDTPLETDPLHTGNVYRFGRYLHAVARLRREVFQAEQDWEHLTYRIGDRIEVQYDVARWGFWTGRVVSAAYATGGDLYSLTLDELVTQATGEPIQVRVRSSTGAVIVASADDSPGSSHTLTFTGAPPDLDGETIEPGDLVTWGPVDRVTTFCLVREIRKLSELGARVLLVEDNPAIHEADDTIIPEFDPRIVLPPDPAVLSPPPPQIVEVITDERAIVRSSSGALQSRILVRIALSQGTTEAESVAAQDVDAIIVEYRPHVLFASAYASAEGSSYVVGEDPLQGQVTETQWTRLPAFPVPTDRVFASPVIDGQFYDVRLRTLTKIGVPSEWVTLNNVRVIGKTSRPPGVTNLRWSDGVLAWDYASRPIDFDGFRVRMLYGATPNPAWDLAAPGHAGLLSVARFTPSDTQTGARTFMVRAVDKTGLESAETAAITVTIGTVGDDLVGNVIERVDFRALGWPGTKENMSEVTGGDLVEDAGTFTHFWRPRGLTAWPSPTSRAWRSNYPGCSYTFEWTAPGSGIEGDATLIVEATGDEWWIEWKAVDPPMWEGDNFWPPDPRGDVWNPLSDWRPFSARFTPIPGLTYQFRIVAPWNDSGLTVTRCELVLDVRDVVEYITGFEVADTGTVRLPPTKAFRGITGIQMTIQIGGSPYNAAFTAAIIDRSTAGPAIEVYDVSGSRVPGIVDAIIQGF